MAGDVAPEVPPTGQVVKPKRVAGAVLDMIRSLGVLAVVVGLTLLFVPGLLHPSKSQRFASVGYSDYTASFKKVTGIPAVVPVGLASGWYANSATLGHNGNQANLYIGWVTPASKYLALHESNEPPDRYVATVLDPTGLQPQGRLNVSGAVWTSYAETDGDTAIVGRVDGVTVVISGSGSRTAQSELAASLRQSLSTALGSASS